MSHTDKTQPWWTQVTNWEPRHSVYCFVRGCDLPTHYPRNHNEATHRHQSRCYWVPADWYEVSWPKYREWYEEKQRSRGRAKRSWRKDWAL